jgi:hypothetical protein
MGFVLRRIRLVRTTARITLARRASDMPRLA